MQGRTWGEGPWPLCPMDTPSILMGTLCWAQEGDRKNANQLVQKQSGQSGLSPPPYPEGIWLPQPWEKTELEKSDFHIQRPSKLRLSPCQ